MNISLEHPFIRQSHNLNELLEGCYKLSTFINRLKKQSTMFPDRYDPEKYKGDGFELFVEALIKLHPVDNRIGISDYRLEDPNKDIGIDGYGIGIDGMISTVQVKFRGDHTQQLTANTDHLSNFTSASKDVFINEAINNPELLQNIQSKNRMLIVTTADGLHHFTDNEMYSNMVRCIGYKELRQLVDNNIIFWDKFRQLLNI